MQFLFKNTTLSDILHNGTGILFPAMVYTFIDYSDIIKLVNSQLIGWLLDGTLLFNDGVVDYVPEDAINHLSPSGLATNVEISKNNTWLSASNIENATLEQVSRNIPNVNIIIPPNYTRVHPNLSVTDTTEVDVQLNGELIVL